MLCRAVGAVGTRAVQYSDSYVKPSPSSSREQRPRFSPGALDTRPLILVGGRLRDIEISHLAELERLRRPAGARRGAQTMPSSSQPQHPADVPEVRPSHGRSLTPH